MEVAGVAFHAACALPGASMRRICLSRACALAWLQQRAPVNVIMIDEYFWSTPYNFHCQNTLDVSRAIYERVSTPE
jgi:hypothetical protein